MSSIFFSSKTHFQGQRNQRRMIKTIVIIILISFGILILLPFWWMVSTSLKSMKEIMQYPPSFIPNSFLWSNYLEAWKAGNFWTYTKNTFFIAGFAVVSHVLSNSFVAYGFAKIRFPGRNFLFAIVLGTLMIPNFVSLVPQYILFAKIQWVGTYLPLIVPHFFAGPFSIFLIRQFYLTIPNDLIEAAKMDGANHFYIWFKIMIPLSKPALATIAVLSFTGAWNDFLYPLIYINDEAKYTLQIGMQAFKGTVQTQWNYLMAGSVIIILPVLALFFMFQKYFIEGMNISAGTKG